MYIITEDTPNPNVKKFIPGRDVMGDKGTFEALSKEDAGSTLLGQRLMDVDAVSALFFGKDFISVTKNDSLEWKDIRLDIIDVITEHYLTGQALFKDDAVQDDIEFDEKDKEIVEQIIELIDTRVRPAVAQDGGDITFRSYKEGVVFVQLKGACSGCPSSTMTLKGGIENMLKHYIPEVIEVLPV